jgi:hypothetical protein
VKKLNFNWKIISIVRVKLENICSLTWEYYELVEKIIRGCVIMENILQKWMHNGKYFYNIDEMQFYLEKCNAFLEPEAGRLQIIPRS